MATSRTFRSGDSIALRLPKEVAFASDVEVTIVRSGDVLIVYPSRSSVKEMLVRLAELPGPEVVQVRDTEPLPERPTP